MVNKHLLFRLLSTAIFFGVVFPQIVTGGQTVKIINGSHTLLFTDTPRRAVSLNQAATEILLALKLDKQMVGTAYLDDKILPRFQQAYDRIPVLSKRYPAKEILLDARPDFVYASYSSGFSPKRGLPDRKELHSLGIMTYLSPMTGEASREQWSMEFVYNEVVEIGSIFNVPKQACQLVETMREQIRNIPVSLKKDRPRILWLDQVNETDMFVGTGNGAPQEIISLAGGDNVFANINRAWANVTKEAVLDCRADMIVLIHGNWETARHKREYLTRNPLFRHLKAVKNQAFVEIVYSSSTPGIRIPNAVIILNEAILTLEDRNQS